MYDPAKLFRTVCVSVLLGLFLADVSVAKTYSYYASDDCMGKAAYGEYKSAHEYCAATFKKLGGYKSFYVNTAGNCEFVTNWGSSDTCRVSKKEFVPDKCSSKADKKFRDGTLGYEIKGKGSSEKVALNAGFFGGPVGICDDGCAVAGRLQDVHSIHTGTDQEKAWVTGYEARYTGKSCTVANDALGLPDPQEPVPTPDPSDLGQNSPSPIVPGFTSAPKPTENGASKCPPGRCPGSINGVDVCVACDTTISASSSSKKTESTTKPSTPASDGDGNGSGSGSGNGSGDGKSTSTSTEESSSVTKCNMGVCETTTKSKSKDGKGTKETNSTTKQSQADYCAKNPQDEANCTNMVNAKDGKKDGSEGNDECKKDPNRLGCLKLGENKGNESINKSSQNVTFTPGNFSTGSGCPAPKTFQMFNQTYKLEFTKFCDLAKYFKPLILLAASITAMFIVINGLQK